VRHPVATASLPRGIRLRIGPPPPPDLHLLSISRT
jgi:hypothetical protein